MKRSMGCLKAVAALACAGASMSASAVAIDFADIMNGDTAGATYSADGTTLIAGTEKAAKTAVFTQGSLSVTFTAGGDRFVYLDANPDNDTENGGSGVGVCGSDTNSCGAEDEVGIEGGTQEVLFADFGKIVHVEDLLFSEENNRPLIDDVTAEELVEISLDGGSTWTNFVAGMRYTAQTLGFRVDAETDLNLAEGNEFYLHGLSVVPLPAAAWLFGSMLLALGGFNYRRRGLQAA